MAEHPDLPLMLGAPAVSAAETEHPDPPARPGEQAIPAIDTERLSLRRSRVADAELYHRLWTERDPRVPPHRRLDSEGRPTVEDIEKRLRADPVGPGLLTIEIVATGEAIGYCGLIVDGHGSPDEPELAYELLRSAHGHGFATEAARAVVAWADTAGYRRLWAGVRDWNAASRRVLAKAGFRENGRVDVDPLYGDSVLTVREVLTVESADDRKR